MLNLMCSLTDLESFLIILELLHVLDFRHDAQVSMFAKKLDLYQKILINSYKYNRKSSVKG